MLTPHLMPFSTLSPFSSVLCFRDGLGITVWLGVGVGGMDRRKGRR